MRHSRNQLTIWCLAASVTVLIFGCRQRESEPKIGLEFQPSDKVVAVSYPLQYFTQRIAGTVVKVEFPASESPRPSHWKPSAQQIAELQQADLVITNGSGAEYAHWLIQTTLPENRICETCQSLSLEDYIPINDYQIVHSHGSEGEHSHAYFVPYTWLDPKISLKQAEVILEWLISTYPENEGTFIQNFAELKKDLEALSDEMNDLKPADGESITVFTANPQLKFLTRAIGWRDQHLLWFPERANDLSNLAEDFQRRSKGHKVTQLLTTDDLASPIVEFLVEHGVETTRINLLDHPPPVGDYLTEMREILRQLRKFLLDSPG